MASHTLISASASSTLLELHSSFLQGLEEPFAEATNVSTTTTSSHRSSAIRAFVPLTPIIASPLLTPIITASSSLETNNHVGSDKGSSSQIDRRDHRGHVEDKSPPRNVERPTWFSTPPTPPRPETQRKASNGVYDVRVQPAHRGPIEYPLSPKLPLERSNSASQLLRPFHLSESDRNSTFQLQHVKNSTIPLKGQRAIQSTAVDFPVYESDKLLYQPAIHAISSNNRQSAFNPGVDVDQELLPTRTLQGANLCSDKAELPKNQDFHRRYHALMELLRSEANYLSDLHTLVQIYIHQLPMVTTTLRGNTASYFTSSSPLNVVAKALPSSSSNTGLNSLPMIVLPPSAQRPEQSPITPITIVRARSRSVTSGEAEKKSLPQRRLFTDEDIALLARNANFLLDFHDCFVKELKEAVAPFGPLFSFTSPEKDGHISFPLEDNLNVIIQTVAAKFVDKATSFNIYQSFCSTHTEACELIRRTKSQFPVEWAVWEKRCSSLVEHKYRAALNHSDAASSISSSNSSTDHQSNHFPELLNTSQHPVRPRFTPSIAGYPLPSAHKQSSRLSFVDYLIKPVQRICKYHLLLDQLKLKEPSSSHEYDAVPDALKIEAAVAVGSQTDSIVKLASSAMHAVVESVNDDRRRHEYHSKSLLVASRIISPSLSLEFMRSLGACLLVGALDVLCHCPSNTTKSKYLGAFLYVRGYIVLAKVLKGKTYEALHWFALSGFEIVDQEEEDPGFPYSFHLICKGHHFQFAAACQKEKEVWMEGLRESTISTTDWEVEPPSSLREDNREELTSSALILSAPQIQEQQFPNQSLLPTIESLPELENNTESPPLRIISKVQPMKRPKTPTRDMRTIAALTLHDTVVKQDPASSLSRSSSRRSSTTSTSVRSIFSPFIFDSSARIVRVSSLQRQNVEHGLADVFSDLCRDARSRAEMHSLEPFQLSRKLHPSVTRSSSIASYSLGSKCEKKLASRRSYGGSDSLLACDRVPRKQKTWSDLSCRRGWSVGDSEASQWTDHSTSQSPEILPDYSTDAQFVPFHNETFGRQAALNSPTEMALSLPPPVLSAEEGYIPAPETDRQFRPKRSQSMVENFWSFFSSYKTSNALRGDAYSTRSRTKSTSNYARNVPNDIIPSSSSTTIRKRAQSVPSPVSKTSILTPVAVFKKDDDSSEASAKSDSSTTSMVVNGRQDNSDDPDTLVRKRSFLHPYSRRNSTANSEYVGPTRRKSLKDILLYFKSTPIST